LEVEQWAKSFSPYKTSMLQNITQGLGLSALVSMVMTLQFPYKEGNFLTS
jgi:hypothetical protein